MKFCGHCLTSPRYTSAAMQLCTFTHEGGFLLRCITLLFVFYGIYSMMRILEPEVNLNKPLSNELHFDVETGDKPVHIAMLVNGQDACHQAITMMKSLLLTLGRFNQTNARCASLLRHYSLSTGSDCTHCMTPVKLYLIVDLEAHSFMLDQLTSWRPRRFSFHFYPIDKYMGQVKNLGSSHYSGSQSYLKLLLPYILPQNVDKVIMLDADMLLATSIHSLWRLFDQFNATQAIGMVQEQNPFFWAGLGRLYWPTLGYGYNAGLVLFSLNKLRARNWARDWHSAYTELAQGFGGNLPTAEQDVLNRVGYLSPELLFDIDCSWNVQLASFSLAIRCPVAWSFTENGRIRSNASGVNEAHLLHFNAHFKPEASYPKPWRIPRVEDNGQVLTHIERARKYYELYYALRRMDTFCFN
ncbi:putative tata-binding protein-associated phosphoprotein [Fasciola hepatica]|uniref:Tata-binding protein-associated phosphoprotein n=1 Tax=Fasciola hepatica TaxID=6192 RepID=A0A4E0S2A7_FASHE|nr:putative tata-binding protein-associated phosphoprotein [Fasciola hepatica]